ncbi:MAG: hypothetical protein LC659_03795 [Myxococcales bacterium]|nr:hypothetical protein [Myxococcales bacterium]
MAATRGGRGRFVISMVLVAAVYWAVAVRAPSGTRSLRAFDADRLAALEVGMWQAYYAKEKFRLFRLLVVMLREQYHYSWQTAVRAAFHVARAAATFGDSTGDYERVLPDLEAGYAVARDWTGARFDPAAVARAELSWWTARRDGASGEGAHKNAVVAARVTELYALVYDAPAAAVAEAARLRVDAADLRDRAAAAPDWNAVSYLLHQSYRSLHLGVAAPE